MFDFINKKAGANQEEALLDKQLDNATEQGMLQAGSDPNADIAFLQMQKDKEDLIRWQQDLVEELFFLQLDLKRMYVSNGKLESYGEDPACNNACIEMIKTTCRPLLSRNMMMTNFSEARILQLLKRTMSSIVRNICINHDHYEISFFDISYILTTIKNYIMPAPFRAMNSGERKHLETTNRRIENVSERLQTNPQKRGLFGPKK